MLSEVDVDVNIDVMNFAGSSTTIKVPAERRITVQVDVRRTRRDSNVGRTV